MALSTTVLTALRNTKIVTARRITMTTTERSISPRRYVLLSGNGIANDSESQFYGNAVLGWLMPSSLLKMPYLESWLPEYHRCTKLVYLFGSAISFTGTAESPRESIRLSPVA